MSTAAGAHVLVYPYPSSGHIIPFLDLTHRLLTRGLTVTLLVTPKELPLLEPLISAHSPSSLRPWVEPIPEVPPSTPNRHVARIRNLRDHHEPALIKWFQNSHASPPVVAIVSDFFLGWTHQVAGRVGVKRIVFSPSGAFSQSISFALWRNLPKMDNPNDENSSVSFADVPNSPIYPWWQIPPLYRNGEEGDPDWEFYRSICLANIASWGIVFNSFYKLEHLYLEHLKKEVGHDRVWAVGPSFPPNEDPKRTFDRGAISSLPRQEIATWLESREDRSVVYVCFGSRARLTGAQMEVLTAALEHSRIHFLFCVIDDSSEKNAGEDRGEIPDGFEERVRHRGLVIRGWAPQVAILRHRAVGAFLTHCGWNSVLEGLAAGKVMLTWPMGADQFTNAKLLVEQTRVGVRVGEGNRMIPEPAELARLLVESLDGTLPERVRAEDLSRAAMEAVGEGGSSDKDLDELVKCLNELSE